MRVFAFVLGASLVAGLGLGGVAEAAPLRVASLNLCTDELLLMLAEPGQIASVTHLAQQEAETPLWRQARLYPRNDGSLLSVLPQRPDLLLTMGGGARDRTVIAGRLGIRTVDLPYPRSLADIEKGIALVAVALGRPKAGRSLVGRIAALRRSAPPGGVDTIWLGGGGRSVASEGLAAQWMALAGLRQRPLKGDRVSLEQLLTDPPALLLRSDYRAGQYSGEQRWLAHPLARRASSARSLATDGRRWTCMGPMMIGEIERLRAEARP